MGSRGLRFECTQCGLCCTTRGEYAHVYLDDEEVEMLAGHLGVSARAFRRRYTFVDEDGWRQLSFVGDRCVFLEPESGACRVYPARPVQCRTFPFWRDLVRNGRWTQGARSLCEGVGRGRLHPPEEVEARMLELEESEPYP